MISPQTVQVTDSWQLVHHILVHAGLLLLIKELDEHQYIGIMHAMFFFHTKPYLYIAFTYATFLVDK